MRALDDVDLTVDAGEFLVVRGPSGSGKSTLLLTLGGMIRPTGGRVVVGGTDVCALSSRARAAFRAQHIGFVFQMFHLVPYLSVIDNVLLPTVGGDRQTRRASGVGLLERFGLSDRLRHKPSALSTGERQRAALARALVNRPTLVLADEPTGNLDPDNAAEVMQYLSEYHHDGGTVIVVTHTPLASDYAQRVLTIRQGRVETEGGRMKDEG